MWTRRNNPIKQMRSPADGFGRLSFSELQAMASSREARSLSSGLNALVRSAILLHVMNEFYR